MRASHDLLCTHSIQLVVMVMIASHQQRLESEGKLTRISFLNRWGGMVYNHPLAGAGFSPGTSQYLNFRLSMGLTTSPNCISTFSSNYNVAGPVIVYYRPGWTTIQGKHMNWMDFPFDTPFDYDGTSNLVVGFEWDAISGANLGILVFYNTETITAQTAK